MSVIEARRYRFPPLVRAGMLGQFSFAQLVVLATGVAVAFVLFAAGIGANALGAVAVGGVVGLVRVERQPLCDRAIEMVRWRRRKHRWRAVLPFAGALAEQTPLLQGLEVRIDTAGRALVVDRFNDTTTAVLSVQGDGQFLLAPSAQQDLRVAGWGDALTGFCREGTPVREIVVHHRTVGTAPLSTGVDRDYDRFVTAMLGASTRDDVLVALVAKGRSTATVETEVEQFRFRAQAAGLASHWLTARELVDHLRPPTTPASGSLAALVGIDNASFGPLAIDDTRTHAWIDGQVTRSFWVEAWPRSDVPATWLDALVTLGVPGVTVSVMLAPIAPSEAARLVDSASVALDATRDVRTRRGFRIRAVDERDRSEVEAREHELVAGHGSFNFLATVTVTATTVDELHARAALVEGAAAQCGLLLRVLDGRHLEGWCASLPLGRSITATRWGSQ